MSDDDGAVKAIVQGVEGPPDYEPSSTNSPPADSRGSIVRRAMEKTADRLHGSKSPSSKAQLSQSQPALPLPGHKRMFSLSRKGKEKAAQGGDGAHTFTHSADCIY